MKLSFAILSLSALAHNVHGACPFSKTSESAPDDNQHRHLRRRLASLSEGETKDELAVIIKNQQLKADKDRSLLQTACMTRANYDDIQTNIADMASVVRSCSLPFMFQHYLYPLCFNIFSSTFRHKVTNSIFIYLLTLLCS